jgi:drug/metabolite transporter (DMT)-like permease
MGGGEWLMLLALSVLWGGSFFFVAVAVKEIPPFTLVLLRVGIAAALLNVLLLGLGVRLPRTREAWAALAVMSVVNNLVPFTLFVWAQMRLSGGGAAILNATTPLFGVLVAHAFTADERLTVPRLAGVLLGFGGVVVMLGPAALSGFGGELAAQAACLLAALSYALSGVWGRRFAGLGITPIQTAAGQVTLSAVLLLPLALLVDRPWSLPIPGMSAWAAVFALAALSTALGYILFFRILERAGATNLLLVTFLIPVSAILLGAAFLGEAMEARQLVGMLLIGIGLAIIDGRLLRAARAPTVSGSRTRGG